MYIYVHEYLLLHTHTHVHAHINQSIQGPDMEHTLQARASMRLEMDLQYARLQQEQYLHLASKQQLSLLDLDVRVCCCAYLCTDRHVCVYIYVYIRMYKYVYRYVCVRIYMYIYTCIYPNIHTATVEATPTVS